MTSTLNRPDTDRYFRRFAARTALATAVLTSALVAGLYVPAMFDLTGPASVAVGLVPTVAFGIVAAAALAGRQRWAQWLFALVWAAWLITGYAHHGLHNMVTLAQAAGWLFLTVGGCVALRDFARMRAAR